MSNAANAAESMRAAVGADEGVGDWFEVTQDLINLFADATYDHQFIHVDPERAKSGPFGVPIAHGFLTLSLLPHLIGSVKPDGDVPAPTLTGVIAGVNYGFDKVRFVSPVKVNSRIRARAVTSEVTLKEPSTVLSKRTVTVEIDGESRPAVVAEWITMLAFG
jgi:acyl dehydratase